MVILVMGVSGVGKTTIGRRLAEVLGWTFYDADDFHPASNVEKMRSGMPLDDADRLPWLQALGDLIRGCLDRGEHAVLACSALRRGYRRLLHVDDPGVKLVYLKGTMDLIRSRLEDRLGHFMNPMLLSSQFATLEEPENAIPVDVSPDPDRIVAAIRKEIGV